jgi:hypothetical protein
MESVRLPFVDLPPDLTSLSESIDKRMFTASRVPNWMVIIYERQPRFNEQTANQMAADLVRGCEAVGAPYIIRSCGSHPTQALQGYK